MSKSVIPDIGPGRRPRRRSLCVADTWSWCPGRCPRRRSLCVEVTWSWCPGRCLVVRRRY